MSSLRSVVLGALAVATAASAFAQHAPRESHELRQPAQAGPRETLVVRGSTTWEPINDRIPARFAAVEPKIELDIEKPGIGSGGGIRALIEGTCLKLGVGLTDANADGRIDCDVDNDGAVEIPTTVAGDPGQAPDIATSSRAVTAGEITTAAAAGLELVSVQAGRDGLAIVVNSANPVAQLSKANVQNIYLNPAAADWGLYGGTCPDPARRIHVYTRNTNSGTFDSFIDFFITTANRTALVNRMSAGQITVVETAEDGVAAVAGDPCGVFYSGIGDFAGVAQVRPVAAYNTIPPGIVPTLATVQSGAYPFSRGLYLSTIGVSGVGSAKGRFIDWMTTRSGQSIVYEAGFVPSYDIFPLESVAPAILSEYPPAN